MWAHGRGIEPHRWLVMGLTLAMLPGVYASYGTLLGRSAGVALLVILAGMKLLETRTVRDSYVLVFLGFEFSHPPVLELLIELGVPQHGIEQGQARSRGAAPARVRLPERTVPARLRTGRTGHRCPWGRRACDRRW